MVRVNMWCVSIEGNQSKEKIRGRDGRWHLAPKKVDGDEKNSTT